MNSDFIFHLVAFTIPAFACALVVFLFLKNAEKNQEKLINALKNSGKNNISSLQLQAIERMVLFLERSNPSQLVMRILPENENKNIYKSLLIAHIEQEFEHNLSQQIYIPDAIWGQILATKNHQIQTIRMLAQPDVVQNAYQLQEVVLKWSIENVSPHLQAIQLLKKQVLD